MEFNTNYFEMEE